MPILRNRLGRDAEGRRQGLRRRRAGSRPLPDRPGPAPASCFHWQAIHRGAFYRGGPVKTAISSGIDQALWDITGKVYNLPVYKLMGGPTRDRIRVYGQPNPKNGVNAMKVGLRDAAGRALQIQRRRQSMSPR